MVQDDWMLGNFPHLINDSISVLNYDQTIGMIRLVNDHNLNLEEKITIDGIKYYVFDHKNLNNKIHKDYYIYSDTPHIRRYKLNLQSELGLYKEDRLMENCERDYEIRFDNQDKYRIAFMKQGPHYFFKNMGIDNSIRTKKLRYQLNKFLNNILIKLNVNKKSILFKIIKNIYNGLIKILLNLRILK